MKMEKGTPFPFIKFSSRSRDRTKDHFVFAYFFLFQLSILRTILRNYRCNPSGT